MTRALYRILLVASLCCSLLLSACGLQQAEICDDGLDNDADSYSDCADQDCWDESHCETDGDDDDSGGDDDDSGGDDDDSAGDDDDTSGDDDSAGDDDDASGDDDSEPCVDADGDNWCAEDDCDDSESQTNPVAVELCDQADNNCNGLIDENAANQTTWYLDADNDGYGAAHLSIDACTAPAGYVQNSLDCNDLEARSYPGAEETCDEIDNNCDGSIDEGAAAPPTWHADFDGDGHGSLTVSEQACSTPSGYLAASLADDCDDLDATSFPGASEVCDGADNDCDSSVDEDVTLSFFLDFDGDGYGDPGSPQQACFQPLGYSANDGDCDDGAPSAHPGGVEVCDGIDNNCNGSADDDALDAATWYPDIDGDGFGSAAGATVICTQPTGSVSNGDDCDDSPGTGPANFPGNTELCDGQDNDCNGAADILGAGSESDDDGDNQSECEGDCDDVPGSGSAIFSGATELCDGVDSNCDGSLVDGFADYDGDLDPDCNDTDDDNDGDPDGSDCADTDETLFTGAPESCDAIDSDCDGSLNDPGQDECDANASCSADGSGFSCACNTGFSGTWQSCSCDGGLTDCNGTCVDLSSDVNNCGVCGNPCSSGSICSSGSCIVVPTCLASGDARTIGCSPACSKPNFCYIGVTSFTSCVTECDKFPGGRLPIEDGGGGLTGSDCHGSAINAGAYGRVGIWAYTQAHSDSSLQSQLNDENYLVDHGDCNWDTHGGNGGNSSRECLCIHD